MEIFLREFHHNPIGNLEFLILHHGDMLTLII